MCVCQMFFAFMLNPHVGGPLFSTDQDCLLLSVPDMKFISYLYIGIKRYVCLILVQDRRKLWGTVIENEFDKSVRH